MLKLRERANNSLCSCVCRYSTSNATKLSHFWCLLFHPWRTQQKANGFGSLRLLETPNQKSPRWFTTLFGSPNPTWNQRSFLFFLQLLNKTQEARISPRTLIFFQLLLLRPFCRCWKRMKLVLLLEPMRKRGVCLFIVCFHNQVSWTNFANVSWKFAFSILSWMVVWSLLFNH